MAILRGCGRPQRGIAEAAVLARPQARSDGCCECQYVNASLSHFLGTKLC